MSAVEQCLAVEFKCEFAEVIRLVVEIGERLEQAVGEWGTGAGGAAPMRRSSSSSSSISQASLVLRANSRKLEAFLDLTF